MNFAELLSDKIQKPKAKTEILSYWLAENPPELTSLIEFARTAKDPVKATCIEAIEFATKQKPEIADLKCLDFVSETLTAKAPRLKWESAKVIGNVAHLFPENLETAVTNLLVNTEHEGTVVRWSAAFALGQILKTKAPVTKDLIPAAENIASREEKNSIRKFYLDALKQIKK
ncbi:HEAT repeat domain-containing protein [Adhaeribacter sp. BT258]|uniref:HEAT repeat domain-containing protein n=1 Tax=Adhaeribacter terrigena TaxID=2793070 RepID=A0ABS1C4C6_9BACT|nr:HEAT repeat domain-containing protein [Adhaeribacter terrigena]MBK0404244.1 HEAT repeat domain-containing protein [Adhaeribacter terrigena]